MTALVELAPAAPADAATLEVSQLVDYARFVAAGVTRGQYLFGFDAAGRWHQRIYRDRRVDVWLISWLPGQGTELHDHGGSSGAFAVITGTLTEAVLEPAGGFSDVLRQRRHRAGEAVGFDGRHIHDVRNTDDQPALSVHVYSRPLTRMNYYDLNGGLLVRVASVQTDDPETRRP
jgi:predicted metal-dependent enzyme (double-stranded beta helix superfamily)